MILMSKSVNNFAFKIKMNNLSMKQHSYEISIIDIEILDPQTLIGLIGTQFRYYTSTKKVVA